MTAPEPATAEGPGRPAPYPVRVIRSAKRHKTVSARVVEGAIQVRIPAWMSEEQADRTVADIVARLEEKRRCGGVDLEARAQELARRFDLPAPASIRWSANQHHRWGSCTAATGHIRISSRLAEVPPWVLDHVIVHELAHLVVPDHSPAFYELLSRNPAAERATGYLMALDHRAGWDPAAAQAG